MSDQNQIVTVDAQTVAAINSAEIDNQIATAHRFPRDEAKGVEKSTKLATFTKQIAMSCIYMRPVGKKDGIQQFAIGPSIRLAEVMKGSWGNIRIRKELIGTRDGSVGVRWVVHDLESNVAESGEVWRPYFGHEKMIPVITAAAMKIAERDAVFTVVPKAYAEMVMQECRRKIVGEGETKTALYNKVIESFNDKGIETEKLLSIIDRSDYPAGSDEELVFLIGLNNAIADGLVEIDEVFGKEHNSSKPSNLKKTGLKEDSKNAAPQSKKEDQKTPGKKPESGKAESNVSEKTLQLLRDIAKSAGCGDDVALNNVLNAEFSVTIDTLNETKASAVIDYLQSRIDG